MIRREETGLDFATVCLVGYQDMHKDTWQIIIRSIPFTDTES